MALREILSIGGKSGLYKLVAQSRSSIIVEDLESGKKMPVHAAHKVSSLEDISIFTYSEDLPLVEVFRKIREKENGAEAINHKSSGAELRAYMVELLPDYDAERVYDSDLKKLFFWYNLLVRNSMLSLIDEEGAEESGAEEAVQEPEAE